MSSNICPKCGGEKKLLTACSSCGFTRAVMPSPPKKRTTKIPKPKHNKPQNIRKTRKNKKVSRSGKKKDPEKTNQSDEVVITRVKVKSSPKKAAVKRKSIPKKTYSPLKPEEFPLIEFNEKSHFYTTLLKNKGYSKISNDLTYSCKTQIYDGVSGETDIVIGLDFGTANTKVILMEQGRKIAWAIPFTGDKDNPYLLPSRVYIDSGKYSLSGENSQAINDLKLPLLMDRYDEDNRCHAVAFLALVMRQSREWFLQNAASSFNGFEFVWHYHMGLPASNYDNKKLVNVFSGSLLSAAIVSLKTTKKITKSAIKKAIKNVDKFYDDNTTNLDLHPDYVNVFPEISAQLHGYILSDKWDKTRPKFMLVDIGGGTVDASIVNVEINTKGVPEYNFLKSEVKPLGVSMLHLFRMNWIDRSLKATRNSFPHLINDLSYINHNHDQTLPIADSVKKYLAYAKWPKDFDCDLQFYKMYSDMLWAGLIHPVRKNIDTKVDQWKSLQFVLCGGGGQHVLYRQYIDKANNTPTFHVNLDVVTLEKPEKLISTQAKDAHYHRLSVAYGLSHLELGKLMPESYVKLSAVDLTRPKKEWYDFIGNDVM